MSRIQESNSMSTTRMITKHLESMAGSVVGYTKSYFRYATRTYVENKVKEVAIKGVEAAAFKAIEFGVGSKVATTAYYGSQVAKGVFDPYALVCSYLLCQITMIALCRLGMGKAVPLVAMIL